MKVSVVTTLYCSAPYLDEFYQRTTAAVGKVTNDYEIIFVNDGSPDSSLQKAVSLCQSDNCVRVVDLSRNFGHHKAMMTGLSYAKGEMVFLTDCDLEIKPEVFAQFYDTFNQSSADVVYGVQTQRQDSFISRLCANFYYRLFNLLSTDPLPMNLTTTRLMSRRYVSALLEHKEREIVIAGLWAITGFTQVAIPVEKGCKKSSAYTFNRKIAILANSITSFSNKPLIYIFHLGSLIFLISTVAALNLIIRRLFFSDLMTGWSSVIVSIWLLGGLIIFCLGVLGIYLSKIFIEVKQRPYSIVRQVHENTGEKV